VAVAGASQGGLNMASYSSSPAALRWAQEALLPFATGVELYSAC